MSTAEVAYAADRPTAIAGVVLGALLAVVIAVTTPWHPRPGAGAEPGDPRAEDHALRTVLGVSSSRFDELGRAYVRKALA